MLSLHWKSCSCCTLDVTGFCVTNGTVGRRADTKKVSASKPSLTSPRTPKSVESTGTEVVVPVEANSPPAKSAANVVPESDKAGPSGLNTENQMEEPPAVEEQAPARQGRPNARPRVDRRKRRRAADDSSEEEEETEWVPPQGSFRVKRRKSKARRASS
jgi:hypothetical protein